MIKYRVWVIIKEQWLQTLNDAGVQSVVCKGCDEAIKFIESITESEE